MGSERKITLALIALMVTSALIRALVGGSIELGNDEVYYWTYARYPDLSHFDHPPMVGLVIQAFTLNLWFDSEFFLRLGPVVLGTASTWLMFVLGRSIKNSLTGLYAAFLFTSSFYGFVLSGLFILPDTPQVFFWLLSLYLFLQFLPARLPSKKQRNQILYAGLTVGLAFLSKYHALFLLAGAGAYLVIWNRNMFRIPELYGGLIIFLLMTLPVIFWNMENDWISFTFHENRVGITSEGIRPQYFLTELAGQFFYNNPVNVIMIIIAMAAWWRGKRFIDPVYLRIILLTSLPLILLFLGFALFRPTLPHWTGPGYLGLILLAAAWLSERRLPDGRPRLVPWPVATAIGFTMLVIVLAVGQIRAGWIPAGKLGGDDVTRDLAGWTQLRDRFAETAARRETQRLITANAPILTFRWFPAANFEYYPGKRGQRPVYAFGTLERIHKYYWINKIRGPIPPGSDAWYIGLSDDFADPLPLYGQMFDVIIPDDTLVLTRRNDTIRKAFLYRMIGYRGTETPEIVR